MPRPLRRLTPRRSSAAPPAPMTAADAWTIEATYYEAVAARTPAGRDPDGEARATLCGHAKFLRRRAAQEGARPATAAEAAAARRKSHRHEESA